MWSSIANLKENLYQIKLEVHDNDDEEEEDSEFEIYRSRSNSIDRGRRGEDDSSISDRRVSHQFAQSKSPLRTPTSNGIDSRFREEIEQYKTEVQRLRASEAEIKALSVNYAALLKEKEEQISRLHEDNGSLRKNLEASNNGWHTPTNQSPRTLTSKQNNLKPTNNKSPGRQYGHSNQVRTTSSMNYPHKGNLTKQDGSSNGIQVEGYHQGNEKELASMREEHSRSLETMQSKYESELNKLRMELVKERDNSTNIQLKLLDEDRSNQSNQKELLSLKLSRDQHNREMMEIQRELSEKISEIRRLQLELNRRDSEEGDETTSSLKRVIGKLEQENHNLKMEKDELKTALELSAKSSDGSTKNLEANSSKTFPEKEEMEQSIQRLEKDLKGACRERDKALQELSRLKQHLLEKELEESDKMDEDSRVIEELRENCNYQRAQILHLEKALKQAIEGQEDVKKANCDELQKSKEVVTELQQKLASFVKMIDAKNSELLNLQTALGQYYAESEAKGRLERDLVLAREESARLSGLLKDVNQQVELSKRENEEILVKLSQSEKKLSEEKNKLRKFDEDNTKLRRALEQSMTRLNRMSMDSDYFVDRRIVIKLLVTYFQRNHSKEVLDLMVRMLGFSEEDKQRIGLAQQGSGKGVVRGVLGLPGRLVGGILGGSSADGSAQVPSENQSFADLWVDFLLKENEERERRELMETASGSKGNTEVKSPSRTEAASPLSDYKRTNAPTFVGVDTSPDLSTTPIAPLRNPLQPEHSETEFSTVPLTSSVSPSSVNSSRISRLLPRY
ncbi:Golgin candidate [Thalictrum thalictroides]|uniref:Golgin candidate n=1 Tax=Thalictrum thalictroides TaxID=46969 RepID=A0A7J6WC55_THATH|nr:Golgin candidate [Thalictrum thalictroides]